MIKKAYPRLSGNSLKLRVGLAVGLLSGGVVSMFAGWGAIALVVGAITGGIAAYKV